MKLLAKWWPLLLIFSLSIGLYLSPLSGYITWANFRNYYHELELWVFLNPGQAILAFIAIYVLYVVSMLPGIPILDVIAGFLFIQPFSTFLVAGSATLGAMVSFIVVKQIFRKRSFEPKSRLFKKMQEGIQMHRGHYLLFLRLVPLAPFGLVNLVSALLKVPTKTYFWVTLGGILPVSFVYTQAGSGFSELVDHEGPLTLASIFNLEVILALIGLTLLGALPLLFRKKGVGNR